MESAHQSYGNRVAVRFFCFGFLVGFFLFCFVLMSRGILVPQPESVPGPLAVRMQSPNHWTTKEFPEVFVFFLIVSILKT